jgi:hypothetical protein
VISAAVAGILERLGIGVETRWPVLGSSAKAASSFENDVAQKVESALYHSASEVIRNGLWLMKERDELHQTSYR